MRCTVCGSDIPEGSKFCPSCGMPITYASGGSIADDPSVGSWPQPVPYYPSSDAGAGEGARQDASTTAATPLKRPAADIGETPGYDTYKKPIVVAVLASLLVITIGVIYLVWQTNVRIEQDKAAESAAASAAGVETPPKNSDGSESYGLTHSTPVSVTFAITAPGYDASRDSKFVIHVTGLNYKGNKVDEDVYVSSDGKGATLARGSYVASVNVSPLLSDGSLYAVPTNSISFKVDDSGVTDGTSLAFEYVKADPASITDDQVQEAYFAAVASGMSTDEASTLRSAINAKRGK